MYGKHIKIKVVGDGYEVLEKYVYTDPLTGKKITINGGMYSDGATSAPDLKNTDAWIVHDDICRYGVWDDGEKIDNWTASRILSDILKRDGYNFRCYTWRWATFLFGGGAARKNGMRIKKGERNAKTS